MGGKTDDRRGKEVEMEAGGKKEERGKREGRGKRE